MNKRLNLIFWGEDSFSNIVLQSLINAGHNILLVITPEYNNLIYKKIEHTCLLNSIKFERYKNINSEEVYNKVIELNPDLCVVSHFEKLIKSDILSIPKLGFINLHPSLLPYYRGMAPQHWPIINGDNETGITVHFIDEGTDTGNIIFQKKILLKDNTYVSDLQKIWMNEYKSIVVEAIDNLLNNKPTIEQKHLKGSYYGKLKEHQCIIDIEKGIEANYNLIRGVSLPYFGAKYSDIIIYYASIVDKMNYDTSVGELIKDNDKLFLIFKDGKLEITKYKMI